MNRFLKSAFLALALLGGALAPAAAANIIMCQGDVSGASSGARTVGGTLSPVPSGTVYILNSAGCAAIAQGDVGYFQSQGFTQGTPYFSTIFTTGVATGTTDFVIATLPPGTFIRDIIWSNSVAAAVTGGVSLGTTANGTDIVAAQAVGSSALTFTTDALLLKRPFSLTAGTAIHAAAVTAWNSTNVTITIIYGYF